MKIKSFKFVKSYASAEQLRAERTLPEVCAVGRSNVGKSSFINLIANAKVAKTSSEPGHTRLLNYFEVSTDVGVFGFVDLPGYGFSKANRLETEKFSALCDEYFRLSKDRTYVFALVDCRVVPPSVLDKQMIGFLAELRIPYTVVFSKTDKLSKSQLNKNIIPIATELYTAKDSVVLTSALNKTGKEAVLENIERYLQSFGNAE